MGLAFHFVYLFYCKLRTEWNHEKKRILLKCSDNSFNTSHPWKDDSVSLLKTFHFINFP